MRRDANVIGRALAKLRYQRGWTQADLVGKLQMLDCYMTRDILASIETQRAPVTDKHLEYFSEVFGVPVGAFFPPKPHFAGRPLGFTQDIRTRRRRRPRRPRKARGGTR
jgi:transcriptional regulator with XRE-family HTH domain